MSLVYLIYIQIHFYFKLLPISKRNDTKLEMYEEIEKNDDK